MRPLAWLVALAAVRAACAPATGVATSPSPTVALPTRAAVPQGVPDGLADAPQAIVNGGHRWFTVPDGVFREEPLASVSFPQTDATAGHPRARLRSTGRTIDLAPQTGAASTGVGSAPVPQWTGTMPLDGLAPGPQNIDFLVRLRSGSDAIVGTRGFLLSEPEYVVWTLDFEGDAASDETLANTAAIADGSRVPMTLMWNPRVWTTADVSAGRAEVMLAWTKARAVMGDEVALHLHAWTDFVRDAGVAPRTAPSWAGRTDGYDVPLTAFDEPETAKLLARALALMAQHGLPRPTSFRGGGLFANAANLRAVAAAGFSVDASATTFGVFGSLPLPWTLSKGAQPYRPSRDDANAVGDLPLLEVPNMAGNTYGLTVNTIGSTIQNDLGRLPPEGSVAYGRQVFTFVSHPATIDAAERGAIELLLGAFAPWRYDADKGPLRFVTLAQLAQVLK